MSFSNNFWFQSTVQMSKISTEPTGIAVGVTKILETTLSLFKLSRLVCDVFGAVCDVWPDWSSNCKHSVIPDREILWLCVCLWECLHACVFAHASVFWSAACLLLFFLVIREIPLLFLSPTMHCCLYQAAQEVEEVLGCETPPYLPLPYRLSFCPIVYLPSFHSPALLKSVTLKFFHSFSCLSLLFSVLLLCWLVGQFKLAPRLLCCEWIFVIPKCWYTISSDHGVRHYYVRRKISFFKARRSVNCDVQEKITCIALIFDYNLWLTLIFEGWLRSVLCQVHKI